MDRRTSARHPFLDYLKRKQATAIAEAAERRLIDFRVENQAIMAAECGALFSGLQVTHVEYGKVPVEAVLDRTAKAIQVTLTADGRQASTHAWCTCDDDGDMDRWVQYSRRSERGQEAHGFVCRDCRHLLQAG